MSQKIGDFQKFSSKGTGHQIEFVSLTGAPPDIKLSAMCHFCDLRDLSRPAIWGADGCPFTQAYTVSPKAFGCLAIWCVHGAIPTDLEYEGSHILVSEYCKEHLTSTHRMSKESFFSDWAVEMSKPLEVSPREDQLAGGLFPF